MDCLDFVQKFPTYQGDFEKGDEFVTSLLMESVSLKQWTIPFGAYVKLELEPIKAVKLYEIGRDIACVLVDQSGHYFLVWVNPYEQAFRFVYDEVFNIFEIILA